MTASFCDGLQYAFGKTKHSFATQSANFIKFFFCCKCSKVYYLSIIIFVIMEKQQKMK